MNNINIEAVKSASVFLSRVRMNADGSPQRWRVNGKIRTWKTRPNEFRVPVKRGLWEFGYIDHTNIRHFDIA